MSRLTRAASPRHAGKLRTMTTTAIISDIHGNQGALAAVIEDAKKNGAERFWCLGDIVGYGSRPLQCLAVVRDLCSAVIKGNHEQAVIDGPAGFNPLASAAIHWTQRELLRKDSPIPEAMEYIASLALRIDFPDATLVHGSPKHPLDEYLFREDTFDYLPRGRDFSPKLTKCFELIDRPCFVGHTHVPGVIDRSMSWTEPADCDGRFETEGQPCFVNIGSVGQPRDGDRRASYVLWDGRDVFYRRVEYDFEAAAQAIFNTENLPDMLGKRLLEGW
ncbi:MAG: diadenosine tetraphosphatase ApaH/serine/threonine PP2A family protein phosphatase [Pseudohongiellaceae bacterium]